MSDVIAIVDCNFPSTVAEESIAAAAGQRLIKGQCKTEDDVIAFAGDASAIIVQYAPLTARVVGQLRRCREGSSLWLRCERQAALRRPTARPVC